MSSIINPESSRSDHINAPPPQRRHTESSAAELEYDQATLNLIPPSEHEMEVYRDGLSVNLTLLSFRDKTPLYFIRNSVFRPGMPDVTIFSGGDKTGAVVGVCNYSAFSTSITIGRGDPARPYSVEWEEVSKTSRDHSSYKFTIRPRGADARKSYLWKRTQDRSIKGTESSNLDRRSWVLEDDATGRMLAVFAARGINKGWKNVGRLRLLATEGRDWEEWALLAFFGLYEKARQRAMARRDLSWFF